jgi:hypothetical protein
MSEKVQLKGGICELNFGYNTKMEVYTNSSSDITKLDEMLTSGHKLLKGNRIFYLIKGVKLS